MQAMDQRRMWGHEEESKSGCENQEINQTEKGDLASFSPRLYFVAAGMS